MKNKKPAFIFIIAVVSCLRPLGLGWFVPLSVRKQEARLKTLFGVKSSFAKSVGEREGNPCIAPRELTHSLDCTWTMGGDS
jgi:hypothetical protein